MAGGNLKLHSVTGAFLAASLVLGGMVALSAADASENLAQERFERAGELFSVYDFEGAEAAYLEALQMDATVQWAHHQLGRIYFSRNELKRALDEFNKEIALHEDSANAFYMRGLTYAFLEDLEKAELDFREFVTRKPDSEAGLNDLAYVLFLQDKFNEAEETLKELTGRYPSSFLANQGLGAVYIETDRFAEAEGFVAKALEYAEGMDLAAFQRYYPSLNPEHAAKGLETIQRGIRHNFNLITSLKEGEFQFDEDTPGILRPYFGTAPGGKYGAVFLAASCSAGYQHTTECRSTSTIATPSAGSWHDSTFSIGVFDSAPSGAQLTTCWQTSPTFKSRTCNSSYTLDSGCTTQGSNTCSVTVDACTEQAGGGTGFGCGGASSRSFSIDTSNPVVGTISPTSATAGQAVTLSASASDAYSGLSDCILFVDGGWQGSMTESGGTTSKSYTFGSAGTYSVYAWCVDNVSRSTAGSPVNVSVAEPPPVISVTPSGSHNYGNVPVGHYGTVIYTVSNTGGGTLSGEISGLAAPFSCLSCSYSVGAGGSTDKYIYFDPTSTVFSSDTAIFSGGGSTSRALSGTGVDWGLQISASPGSAVGNNVGVTLTATTSYTVSGTAFYIRIYEGSTQIASCSTGTSCSSPVQTFSSTTKTYTAKVENFGATEVWDTASQGVTWANPAQISVT
ncbi:MAG: Ig-like domain-containing protein, partial [bacterium]|nr:Ig-like domain-containing protein [bacterium]